MGAEQQEGRAQRKLVVAQGLVDTLQSKLGGSFTTLCTLPGSALEGCQYSHPLKGLGGPLDRTSPVVVGGDYITTESGTGLVHTAPGHGVEDYQVGGVVARSQGLVLGVLRACGVRVAPSLWHAWEQGLFVGPCRPGPGDASPTNKRGLLDCPGQALLYSGAACVMSQRLALQRLSQPPPSGLSDLRGGQSRPCSTSRVQLDPTLMQQMLCRWGCGTACRSYPRWMMRACSPPRPGPSKDSLCWGAPTMLWPLRSRTLAAS